MKEIFFPYVDEIAEEDETIHLDILKAQRDPDDYNIWNRLGNRLAEKEYYAESIACYDRVTHLKPDNITAWYHRGLSLSNLGRYEEAVKSYDKVLEREPDSLYALNSKGSALNYLGKYTEAIKYYNRALEVDPNNTAAWYHRGLSLSNLGRYEEAIECYERALEINLDHTDALNGKGLALERLGRYEEAVKSYDKVLEKDPNNTAAWYHKGCVLLSSGKYSEAERHFNHVYELTKDSKLDHYNVSALVALRHLYSNHTYQFDKSLEISQNLLEIEPSSERRAMLAEDYIKTRSYKKGRECSLHALKDTPPNRIRIQSIIRFLILTSYIMEGNFTNGNKQLAEFIEYYKELEDFKVDEKQWSFDGLIYSINKNDNVSLETKSILIDLIDLLRGKKIKDKILSRMVKDFLNTNVKLQHRIFKLKKKIVMPSILVAAFITIIGIYYIAILPLQQDKPCLIPEANKIVFPLVNAKAADIALNPHLNKVYITTTNISNGYSSIMVMDCSTNQITNSGIQVGREPQSIAVNPTTDKIYVANTGNNTVSVIDGINPNIGIKNVKVGLHPWDIAVNNKTNMIYVSNSLSNTVSVIDGKTGVVVDNGIQVGRNPSAIAVNPTTDKIYVANTGNNTVSVIDGINSNAVKNIPVPKDQNMTLTVDPIKNMIYVLNSVPNQFSIIDGSNDRISPSTKPISLDTTNIVSGGPTIMAVNTNNDKMYAINEYLNTFFITDSKHFPTVNLKLEVGGFPSDIAIDTHTNLIYVVNKDYNTVTVLTP
jgi:YVTN family beta-propeller protein